MKFIDIIKTANHNLFRSKTRTFLTILAIFIGSFTIVLSNAINAGVNDFIDKQVDSIGGEGYIEIAPAIMMEEIAAMMGNSSEIKEYNPEKGSGTTAVITDEELEKIRQIDGMKSAQFYYLASAEYITSPDT
ncbi:ABC transporter permease, partial [Candidatus Saccharibacteria bacterium]|nr:ABC transporter permease [Candidatus Saccharibacteria bacterium]